MRRQHAAIGSSERRHVGRGEPCCTRPRPRGLNNVEPEEGGEEEAQRHRWRTWGTDLFAEASWFRPPLRRRTMQARTEWPAVSATTFLCLDLTVSERSKAKVNLCEVWGLGFFWSNDDGMCYLIWKLVGTSSFLVELQLPRMLPLLLEGNNNSHGFSFFLIMRLHCACEPFEGCFSSSWIHSSVGSSSLIRSSSTLDLNFSLLSSVCVCGGCIPK